jgi:Tol biopolymer transport system component
VSRILFALCLFLIACGGGGDASLTPEPTATPATATSPQRPPEPTPLPTTAVTENALVLVSPLPEGHLVIARDEGAGGDVIIIGGSDSVELTGARYPIVSSDGDYVAIGEPLSVRTMAGELLTDFPQIRPGHVSQPAWSHVSATLAFSVDGTLYIAAAPEFVPRPLATNAWNSPWSPTSDTLAYAADGAAFIASGPEFESRRFDLPETEAEYRGIVWAPTGDRFLIEGTNQGGSTRYLVELATGKVLPLPRNIAGSHSGTPSFSPDNKMIAYGKLTGKDEGSPFRTPVLGIFDLASGTECVVEPSKPLFFRFGGHPGLSPRWSADGDYVAYSGDRDQGLGFVDEHIASPSECRDITVATDVGGLEWTRDGHEAILFTPGTENTRYLMTWDLENDPEPIFEHDWGWPSLIRPGLYEYSGASNQAKLMDLGSRSSTNVTLPEDVSGVASISPSGRYLLYKGQRSLYVVDVETATVSVLVADFVPQGEVSWVN